VKPTLEQLENLMALRREERPDEGYWKDFLCEFHQRQREEAARKPGIVLLFDRAKDWFGNLGPAKWAYGAGLAYAAVFVGALMTPKNPGVEHSIPTAPVNHQAPVEKKVPTEQLNQLDLNPSTQGTAGEQVF
jgi:hypothetical protein